MINFAAGAVVGALAGLIAAAVLVDINCAVGVGEATIRYVRDKK